MYHTTHRKCSLLSSSSSSYSMPPILIGWTPASRTYRVEKTAFKLTSLNFWLFPSFLKRRSKILPSFILFPASLTLSLLLTQRQSSICHRFRIPADHVLLPCLPLSKSEFSKPHSLKMVTSYHHFLGQLGIVTSPSSQRVRISKVMLVTKPGVGDRGRKGRKENMRTHTREQRHVLV